MRYAALLLLGIGAACAPKRVHERPIMANDDRIGSMDATVAAARQNAGVDLRVAQARRDSLAIAAAATCAGETCTALARGEVAIGMSEAQVMAATHTTPEAWTVRRAGDAS